MGKLLNEQQRQELKEAHRCESKRQYADRIKAVLLLDVGWSASKIAEALLLDERSVWNYKKLYEEGGIDFLCSANHQGRQCRLTVEQQEELMEHLRTELYSTALEVSLYVRQTYGVSYSISGMRDFMHSLGFSYKKAKVIPGKADASAQKEFLAELEEKQERMGPADKLYYMDGTHPQYNTVASFGWILTGEDFELKSNTGRKRVNLNGALDAQTHEVIIREDSSINAQSTIALLKTLEKRSPDASVIYVVADHAGYYRSCLVQQFLAESKVELLFLPPYAPNLNLIERVWKFFKDKALANRYFESYTEFREACLSFFKKCNLRKCKGALASLLAPNFQIIDAR